MSAMGIPVHLIHLIETCHIQAAVRIVGETFNWSQEVGSKDIASVELLLT